ncbi:MAG: tRNA uridine-5-carboxymethylaminomethyl(34) synthesis enzyme MnmG [Lentisphaerae bacterium]|nr:tRNA uridine-5-carboxymethylaminomethyl(34) synthesis enzyme MnmG [Lentisphaerota bacterium]
MNFEIIVVGGGHAGCEAALAAARLGAKTVLITPKKETVARMPCNPSIGGIAKSHLVHELQALGGEIGRNADATGIQFRTLNTRKGPAVRATRIQCDKAAYSKRMLNVLETTPNLHIAEQLMTEFLIESNTVVGVIMDNGELLYSAAVIFCPGTSLGGTIHVGDVKEPGGGDGAPASHGITEQLRELGFRISRLKTGTPPRLDKVTIDYNAMEIQPGDYPPPLFSDPLELPSLFHVEHPETAQIPCFLTHTTAKTHEIIRSNLSRSSLYGGHIVGTGVRYCPSVEDKIVKFPNHASHHVFIEPEGVTSPLAYPNGISNSLPRDVQDALVASIPGLASARIIKYGYAIEYDYSDPTQLFPSLETKLIKGLFFAGQINGTTGYEEAAAQGFMAAINAVRMVRNQNPIILRRDEAYIGILIDDLVTKGTDEPYRMFTSRAERRLLLRQDNAQFRLCGRAGEIGVVDQAILKETNIAELRIATEIKRLNSLRVGSHSCLELLRRPEVKYGDLPCALNSLSGRLVCELENRVKYEGYIMRETKDAARMSGIESTLIPDSFDYVSTPSLRIEAREKFLRIRPRTLGQAVRIPGITPADISILAVFLRRHSASIRNQL